MAVDSVGSRMMNRLTSFIAACLLATMGCGDALDSAEVLHVSFVKLPVRPLGDSVLCCVPILNRANCDIRIHGIRPACGCISVVESPKLIAPNSCESIVFEVSILASATKNTEVVIYSGTKTLQATKIVFCIPGGHGQVDRPVVPIPDAFFTEKSK